MYPQLKLENQLCFRFYAASRLITQAYHPLLKSLGLTYPQYLVMMVLWEKDHQPVNDIAKRLMLNTNTITPLLKRMENDGLVKRDKDSDDARKVIVSLCPKGKNLEKKAANIPIQLANAFSCNEITPESTKALAESIDVWIRNLNNNTL